jgi:hypothetical protein
MPHPRILDAFAHLEWVCRQTWPRRQLRVPFVEGLTPRSETYILPTPSYTLVSAGKELTSLDVSCSKRPSLVRAAFCCRTMTSCCSAKTFFWLISCRTCMNQLPYQHKHSGNKAHTFCKASFGIDILQVVCRDARSGSRTERKTAITARVKPLGCAAANPCEACGWLANECRQQTLFTKSALPMSHTSHRSSTLIDTYSSNFLSQPVSKYDTPTLTHRTRFTHQSEIRDFPGLGISSSHFFGLLYSTRRPIDTFVTLWAEWLLHSFLGSPQYRTLQNKMVAGHQSLPLWIGVRRSVNIR